ncbi:hypothetical protein RMATCC62417_11638 [Rhizopus microsporus]|nr:hypothetical protein RMATCC62417_11638 [Rhizopus microsporus]
MTNCSNGEDDPDTDDFVPPQEYKLGSDLISRIILTDQQIINVMTKNLVGTPENVNAAVPTEFCDVLYIPNATHNTLPPIIFKIQKNIDEPFIVRVIHYCTLVYAKYKKHPLIVLLGISNFTTSVFSSTVPCVKFPFAKEITSCFWTQHCLLLSSSMLATLSQYIEQLHPLAALGYFMCSQALSMNMLDYGKHDNTIKLLYTIAQGNIKEALGTEDEKLKGISNICDNADSQLIKIKHCIE